MSNGNSGSGAPVSAPTRSHVIPSHAVGWWAIGLALLGLAAWVVLPIITMTFRETYPITDTAVMPMIGVLLVDVAAVFNLLTVFRWKEGSVLNIVATVITVAAALFFTFVVVGELLSGV